MMQEDKQLLLKDLCARLPYGVNVWNSEFLDSIEEYHPNEILTLSNLDYYIKESIEVKPYLRPMSSMTAEEKLRYVCLGDVLRYGKPQYAYLISEQLDYLNAHHFDYRGLIEKGLALEAPEGMYD